MEVNVAPAGSPIALAWLVPLVPAVSAGLLLIVGKRLGRFAAHVAIAAVGCSAVASTLVFLQLLGEGEEERLFVTTVSSWVNAGPLVVDWAMLLDPLSAVMLLLVTWVGLLIHIYSVGYMHGDERYSRFFAYLNLFAASMLVLVTGSSFLTLFVGWELVGLCSYLLIGFWFENREYASAAKKAFIVNRVGDVGFMVAMFVVFAGAGSLAFAAVLPRAEALGTGTAAAVGLLLLVAAAGKSAQIPLYVWLPDAMAGPTPVSALIHAATMVTAGVYLIARVSPIYATVPGVGLVVAWVGILTALLAALIACAQNDSKKILAYSTVSQLGYMFVGVGLGDQVAGIFHLLTHGFFKALLFLAAGSVMHAMANEVDVWKMGGLRTLMPVTFWTSGIATLAISGIPPFSGFFSKEEVLAAALDTPGAQAIWFIGAVVAGITAFYMGRWFFLLFLGEPRWDHHHVHPHESPPSMTVPLVLLAVGSTLGGLMNFPADSGFLHGWLEPSVVRYAGEQPFIAEGAAQVAVVLAGAAGIVAAWAAYVRRRPVPAPAEGLRGLAANRFYVDELYDRVIAWPGLALSRGFALFDLRGVDGTVNGLARAIWALAGVGRRLQTGFVRSYALVVLAGTVLVAVLLLGGVALGGGR